MSNLHKWEEGVVLLLLFFLIVIAGVAAVGYWVWVNN